MKQSTKAGIHRAIPVSAKQLLEYKMEAIPSLIDPIFPKAGLVCLAGSSDTGKSAFLRQLCLHVVSGEERFIGFLIKATHKRAIYVCTEDDRLSIQFLLHKQNRDNRYPLDALESFKYLFETDELLENLEQLVTGTLCDLIVIDCIADIFGAKGSFNESTQVRAFLTPYKEFADRHQVLFIFLHHTGKRTDQLEPSKANLLGSQAFEAKMRMVAELRVDPQDPSLRHFCIVKGNYLSKEFKSASFELRFDEDMIFKNTGNRKPFEELSMPSKGRSYESKEDLKAKVKELNESGLTYREIKDELAISVGYVHKLLKP